MAEDRSRVMRRGHEAARFFLQPQSRHMFTPLASQHCAEPLPANEIQAALDLPGPTLSHHLEQLEKVGLIERVRRERFIFSSVRREKVADLVSLFTACG